MRATRIAALVLVLATGCAATASERYAFEGTPPTMEVFHDTLAPYGEWIWMDGYGDVWRPSEAVVGVDFTPYVTAGTWLDSDMGWYFSSEWGWGWAPFHFGRWFRDVGFGWCWVPGLEWAPAWVDWRFGGGYVAWAPLPPRGYAVELRSPTWVFVEARHFSEPHLAAHLVAAERVPRAALVVSSREVNTLGGWYRGPSSASISASGGSPTRISLRPDVRGAPPAAARVHSFGPRPVVRVRTRGRG